eukprot:CAMPEP_0182945576 /NCGR_PEP_ID=MMETSP0105_2-20130417/55737_1 /TAXON_ID=81532 ORGANISM="Acanthoeca-like sp., Strain 10tr" /NCGR_SAMPLE_ID=MMETSP0105_2 /ASSEMBLY_ACC=CAM_ASM_000205 /LENGTH=748 /DNA_ID=CAMNT_0025085611 /DNA_START=94 /DNA_END=2337 /DNA_ORIENTATION=+
MWLSPGCIADGVSQAPSTTPPPPRVWFVPGSDSTATATATAGDGRTALPSLTACVARLRGAGDECRLEAGVYSEPTVAVPAVSGTAARPVVIAAAAGAEVLIDGTVSLSDAAWQPAAERPGVWTAKLPEGVPEPAQLFLDGEMLTPARWPPARWDDRTMFNWTRWASFDLTKPWAPSKYSQGRPMTMYDAGPLAKHNGSIEGALFVGNIGHMDTWAGRVVAHTTGSVEFTVLMDPRLTATGNTKAGNSIYFVEGLPSLVDTPTEWAYDRTSRTVTVATPNGATPAGHEVRGKAQTYALNVTDAAHLLLANLTFFGTTINAYGRLPALSLDSINFRYPSFSRRMLGDTSTADSTVLWAEPATRVGASGAPPDPADSSFVVTNCTWFGADGSTVQHYSTAGRWVNNLFAWNDWSGHDTNDHRGMGSTVLMASMGGDDVFERNTLLGNGPSVGYGAGVRATVRLNRCHLQADISNDGACIQIRSSSATSTLLAQNWATQSGKGFRLDSGSNTKWVPSERNNTIEGNVAFQTNGIELKNDYNFYRNNLALLPPPFALHGSAATEVFRVDNTRFRGENAHSIVTGNVASSWLTPVAGITNTSAPNVFDNGIGAQLADPFNWDFRPVPGSRVAAAGAGPYEPAMTTPTARCSTYWLPGRREWRASTPIPPNGSAAVRSALDLAFLPSTGGTASSHAIFLAESKAALDGATTPIGVLPPGCNVQNTTATKGHDLAAGSTWWWRVDEVGGTRGQPW